MKIEQMRNVLILELSLSFALLLKDELERILPITNSPGMPDMSIESLASQSFVDYIRDTIIARYSDDEVRELYCRTAGRADDDDDERD
tara:strand:+ start:439 stop:702 length:264 start_codon:yes stop_codon:yes gene_type:complete